MLAPMNSEARIDRSQGVSSCDRALAGCTSGRGSLPVEGTPGTPLTCEGTNSILGVPFAMPTAKMLVTVFLSSVIARGRLVFELSAARVKLYDPAPIVM